MPYIPHTPEALIGRSDSKDPSTTCRGITSEGRPCRRSLAGSSRSRQHVTVAGSHGLDGSPLDPAALFCWQHKSQAAHLETRTVETRQHRHTVVFQRTSIDSLVDRLGVVNIEEDTAVKRSKEGKSDIHRSKASQHAAPLPANTRPASTKPVRRPSERAPRQGGGWSALSFLCCGPAEYESDPERIRPRRSEKQPNDASHCGRAPEATEPRPGLSESKKHAKIPVPTQRATGHQQPLQPRARPNPPKNPPSQTEQLLSLIPTNLSPQTTSLLLAELAKPFSDADEEGYIYMFCLTDPGVAGSDADSVAEVASTALDSPGNTPTQQRRKTGINDSNLLDTIAVLNIPTNLTNPKDSHQHRNHKSILLKIGRASNVHRRMNEWTRQCGYELSLLRFYPHAPPPARNTTSPNKASSAGIPTTTGAEKVPHVRRVERLIHIELASKNVKNACRACGQLHREWFAVEPTREGLRSVNEVVGRWVGWGERVH